jgi:hypothetical protein
MTADDGAGTAQTYFSFHSNSFPAPCDQELVARGFFFVGVFSRFARRANKECSMPLSKRLLAGLGLATLIMESVVIQPAFAADKVSLFKVITAKDEIVIGLAEDDLAQMDGRNAGGIAKMLVAKGSMSVWRYAVHKSASGDLEQAPLHRIGILATDSLRVEPYATPLKVLPIDETKK